MRNEKVLIMVEVAVFAALSIVFGLFKLYTMPQGGSISLALFPILVISLRRGVGAGAITGFIYAVVNCLVDAYGFVYFPLDYLVPSIAMAIVGIKLFSKNPYYTLVGLLLSFTVAFVSYVLSGMVYWNTPLWGSITYNATYVLPNFIFCAVLTFVISTRKDVIKFGM